MSEKVLIACPACGRNVSLEAEACPKCGQPIKDIRDAYVKKVKENAMQAEQKRRGFFKVLTFLFIVGSIVAVITDLTTIPFSFSHYKFMSEFFKQVERKNSIGDKKLEAVQSVNGDYEFSGAARTKLAITPSPIQGKKSTEKVKKVTLQHQPVYLQSSSYDPATFIAALECVAATFSAFNLLSENDSARLLMEVQKILALSNDARKKLKSQVITSSITDTAGKTKNTLEIEIDPFGAYIKVIFTRP